jgi:hypothetical protein
MPQYEPMAANRPNDPFTRAYLECAEWAGLSEEDGQALELAVCPKWSNDALRKAHAECRDFRDYCKRAGIELSEDETADGHDFYLTRNGHGTGFWDRGYGERGKRLTDAAHTFGDAGVWFDAETETLSFE